MAAFTPPPVPLVWAKGETPEWIPIELGFPSSDNNPLVLVTLIDGSVTVAWVYEDDISSYDMNDIRSPLINYKELKFQLMDEALYGDITDDDEIIAWAYLPEPYEIYRE